MTVQRKRRHYTKKVTKEARILKHFRVMRGLSTYQLAKRIPRLNNPDRVISSSIICHIENGRCDITSDRIVTIVEKLNFTMEEFNEYIKGEKTIPENYLENCIFILRKLSAEKLGAVYGILKNFS